KRVEARTRELRPALDIQDPQAFTEFPVRLRLESERLRLVLAHHDVVVLILAARDLRMYLVRDPEEPFVELGLGGSELAVDRADLVAHFTHSRLDRLARRAAAAGLVPLCLDRLPAPLELAADFVPPDDAIEPRVDGAPR